MTRWVAEGVVRLEQMLIVTFGRAASQELRERVRTQLVEAERALADPASVSEPSELVALLLDADDDERKERRQRLRDALGAFDGATIATTHQFCHLVLRSLGVAGDTDSSATLVEDLDDLLAEVVDDLYLRRFGDVDGEPLSATRRRCGSPGPPPDDPQALLQPDLEQLDPDGLPGLRVAFATEVRDELDRRKRRLGVLSYDDLLSQLADALTDDAAPARERMRQRWQVVLVDEFQDTDPVQWQVLDRAFTGHATMVLIGDPKQAIYAFRGGDVATYLRPPRPPPPARRWPPTGAPTPTCSTRLQVVLRGAALGDDGDRGARRARAPRTAAGSTAPAHRSGCGWCATRPSAPGPAAPCGCRRSVTTCTPTWRATSCGCSPPARRTTVRTLEPRDIAVIAYRNHDLRAVQRALVRARRARRGRRQRQRLRHAGGHRVAAAAGGARAAAPLGAGAQRGADVVLRLHGSSTLDAGG